MVSFIKKHDYCTMARRIAGSQTIEKQVLKIMVMDVALIQVLIFSII